MVFSSVLFLFLFLPIVISGYYLLHPRFRNLWLLAASLFFYAWGETFYVVLMLCSVGMNYVFGYLTHLCKAQKLRAGVVTTAVVCNLGLLTFYKYGNFLADNLNNLLQPLGAPPIHLDPVHLPIGISFFTFQAMSYVIDIYRRESEVQRNPVNLALYIALFPQLIAGPIVRYHDVAQQINKRRTTVDDFAIGANRFIIGLSKKVLIANTFAVPADAIFALNPSDLTTGVAWLGAISYTLQIYFDFSGYSDMAIGLGRMFGFHFLENFNYPYIASSITNFWRRWHISLSSWFRDYLYIPLGGNRKSSGRTYFNLVTVFALCGLWHGASWTFVFWGLYHGFFLVLERWGFNGGKVREKLGPLAHVYTLIVVVIGWVFFRAETFGYAVSMLQAMFGLHTPGEFAHRFGMYWNNQLAAGAVLGLIGSTPLLGELVGRARNHISRQWIFDTGRVAWHMALLILCAILLSAQTHNPFIYFRF